MANEVKFRIKMDVDGKEKIVEASADVKKLAEEMGIARSESDKLRNTLLKFNNVSQAFQNVVSGLQQVVGVMSQYTSAAAQQEEAEAKLANNMRNTKDARDDEVKSILELVSAQQRLGGKSLSRTRKARKAGRRKKKVAIIDCLGFALGCVGLSLDDFCRLTREEFESVVESYASQRNFFVRNGWERMRMLASIVIQPHLKKKITPEKLLPFDWEKKGGDRPRREVVSKEESKRRFLERMVRSYDE